MYVLGILPIYDFGLVEQTPISPVAFDTVLLFNWNDEFCLMFVDYFLSFRYSGANLPISCGIYRKPTTMDLFNNVFKQWFFIIILKTVLNWFYE